MNVRLLVPALLISCALSAQEIGAVRELKQLWKYDEAVAALTQMMAEQGPQPVLLEELADCHYQSGNAAEALAQYALLAEMQPEKLLYKLRLMNLLYRGRQYEPAIGFGREVLQRDSITQVLSLVGDAFNQLERRDSAEWYYRRALARRPHNESVLNKLSGILLGRDAFFLRSFNAGFAHIDQDKALEPNLQSAYALEYLRNKLILQADFQLTEPLSLNVSYSWLDRVGNYEAFEGGKSLGQRAYEPYSLLDARLTWEARRFRLFLEGSNLLNISYYDHGNIPQPGIRLQAGVLVRL